eukprot:2388622-Prymnesium_polylepis.1
MFAHPPPNPCTNARPLAPINQQFPHLSLTMCDSTSTPQSAQIRLLRADAARTESASASPLCTGSSNTPKSAWHSAPPSTFSSHVRGCAGSCSVHWRH